MKWKALLCGLIIFLMPVFALTIFASLIPEKEKRYEIFSEINNNSLQSNDWLKTPEKLSLDSGILCFYQNDARTETTIIQVFIRGGKAAVPENLDGLAFLTTRLCTDFTDSDKVRIFVAQSPALKMSVFEDFSVIEVSCRSENVREVVKVLSEMVENPILSSLRIQRIKDIMRLLSKFEDDESINEGRKAIFKMLFGLEGYGTTTYGSEESLKLINKKHVENYFEKFFCRENIFFSVVSNLNSEKIKALLDNFLRKLSQGNKQSAEPITAAKTAAQKEMKIERNRKQVYLGRGYMLPSPDDKNYPIGCLLEFILGKGPESYLWPLRQLERLAYSVEARITWTEKAAVLETYLETSAPKTANALEVFDRMLADLWTEGIDEAKLRAAKFQVKSHFLRQVENRSSRAFLAGFWEMIGLGYDYAGVFLRKLEAVQLADINNYIKLHLAPEKAVSVIVGQK